LINSIVVGNGKTRKGKDLQSIQRANIIACNWFFRDEFEPDILVTSDDDITKHILKKYPNLRCHYKSKNKYSSGATGTYIAASKLKSNSIFLVGMDFFGIDGKVNNLYSGKLYYTGESMIAPDSTDWQIQFEWIIKEYPNINFYHVDPLNGESPQLIISLPNFHQVTYEGMMRMLKEI
tara:strand:+ start:1046 stop:1579 length:534 start_codon:yes stop_codon:yes gene_type:complete